MSEPLQDPPAHARTGRRPLAWILVLGALLLVMLWLVFGPRPAEPSDAVAPPELVSASGVPELAPRAETPSPSPIPSAASDTSAATAAPAGALDAAGLHALEQQWCSHGAGAYEQFTEAVIAQLPGEITPEALEKSMQQWPAHRAKAQLRQEIRQAWIAALRRRGDLRAQATALFLEADSDPGRSVQALTALARRHADPYVAALAAQRARACAQQDGCQVLSPEERLAKDPDNLLVLLEAYDGSSEWLPRLATQLNQRPRLQHHSAELLQTVLALPAATQPGLRREVELDLLVELQGLWFPPYFLAPLRACKTSSSTSMPGLSSVCEQLAQTLWTHSRSLLDQDLSLSVAKVSGLDGRAPWPARRAELEVLRSAQMTQLQALAAPHASTGNACHWQSPLRTYYETLARHGELRAIRDLKQLQQP